MTIAEGLAPSLDERFAGVTFNVPAPVLTVAAEHRLAAAFFSGGPGYHNRDLLEYDVSPGAVDLGLARTGRAPFLEEHCHNLDSLLGMVVAAEVEGPLLRAVVRFAEGGRGDRYWRMLCEGFPLSISMGARIIHGERASEDLDGRPLYRALRWELKELSLVVYGKDTTAFMRGLRPDDGAAAMVARLSRRDGTPARTALRNRLCLDAWERWGRRTGSKLAIELGTDAAPLSTALQREVAAQCAQLERDLVS